jgi:ribosomal protein S18 acetylase RimI-like enzyme
MTAISVAPTSERQRAIAVVNAAFRNDPVSRWVYPDDAVYESAFPRIIEAMSGRAFDQDSAYATSDLGGVALWLPPGIHSDGDAMGALMSETVAQEMMDDLNGFAEVQAAMHIHEPHWYLPMIGVEPQHQGKGYGSQLLSHALAIADRDGLPAYLESTTPDSRRLYERHGFEVVGEIQFGSSPCMWPMRREPRS